MEFDACNSYIWPRKAIRDGQGKFGITLNDPTTFKLFSHMKAINQYTEMWMQRWRRALLAFPFHSRFFITSPARLSRPSVGAARGETAATAASAPARPVSPVMPVSRLPPLTLSLLLLLPIIIGGGGGGHTIRVTARSDFKAAEYETISRTPATPGT